MVNSRGSTISHTDDVVLNRIKGKLNNGWSLCIEILQLCDLNLETFVKNIYCIGALRTNRKKFKRSY